MFSVRSREACCGPSRPERPLMISIDAYQDRVYQWLRHEPLNRSRPAQQAPSTSLCHLPRHFDVSVAANRMSRLCFCGAASDRDERELPSKEGDTRTRQNSTRTRVNSCLHNWDLASMRQLAPGACPEVSSSLHTPALRRMELMR